MNRLVFFIVMLFVVCLTSCGTQRTVVSQEVQTDSQTLSKDSTYLQKQIDKMVRQTMDEILNREIEQNITVKKLQWSPPDTSGHQYVQEEVVIDAVVVSRESKKREIEVAEEVREKIDSTAVVDTSSVVIVDCSEEVEQANREAWLPKLALIAGIAIFLLFILKILVK